MRWLIYWEEQFICLHAISTALRWYNSLNLNSLVFISLIPYYLAFSNSINLNSVAIVKYDIDN